MLENDGERYVVAQALVTLVLVPRQSGQVRSGRSDGVNVQTDMTVPQLLWRYLPHLTAGNYSMSVLHSLYQASIAHSLAPSSTRRPSAGGLAR